MSSAEEIDSAYRRHLTMVRGRALRLLGSEAAAADVAQETFVKLIEYRRKAGPEDNTAAFLYRLVTNLALNRLRDTRRRAELLDSAAPVGASSPEPTDRLALRKVLAAVGEEEAQIAAYYYVDGLEQEEIAALLGLERRTVGRRLERFCVKARRLLDAREVSRA
jgi:RNA polymerase sigma-70 factor (ECF subfamily)